MTKRKAAAERVTEAEAQARRFFYWGFAKDSEGNVVSQTARVTRVHRWINQPWGTLNDKLIDLTGALRGGVAFSVEVKQFDTRLGNSRFEFSSIANNQRTFLTRDFVHGCLPLLWLSAVVPSSDRRRDNYVMFLIPWEHWLDMESIFFRVYKNGNRELWRSINLPWLFYFFDQYRLTEFSYKVGKQTERAWFTYAEARNPRRTPDTKLPIPHTLSSAMGEVRFCTSLRPQGDESDVEGHYDILK